MVRFTRIHASVLSAVITAILLVNYQNCAPANFSKQPPPPEEGPRRCEGDICKQEHVCSGFVVNKVPQITIPTGQTSVNFTFSATHGNAKSPLRWHLRAIQPVTFGTRDGSGDLFPVNGMVVGQYRIDTFSADNACLESFETRVVASPNSCTNPSASTINIQRNPVLNPITGQAVTFTIINFSALKEVKVQWSALATPVAVTTNTISHVFDSAGTYTVTFTAKDINCSNALTVVQTINVDAPPGVERAQASLVVRQFACLSCHAKVDSNMVTDFGLGDAFFYGANSATRPNQLLADGSTANDSPMFNKYSHWGNTWVTAAILGDLIIPKTGEITDQRIFQLHQLAGSNLTAPLTLKTSMTSKISYFSGIPTPPSTSDIIKFTPIRQVSNTTDPSVGGLRGQIVEKNNIWIGAPTEQHLLDLKNRTVAEVHRESGAFKVFKLNRPNISMTEINGDVVKTGTSADKKYWFLSGNITCKGDILVEGVVVISNANLTTDNRGCRIHATGTIFIQGNVIVPDTDKQNLQLTSSRSIQVGFRFIDYRQLRNDLLHGLRYYYTKETESAFRQLSIDDKNITLETDVKDDAGPVQVRRAYNPGNADPNLPTDGTVIGYRYKWDITQGTFKETPEFPYTYVINKTWDCVQSSYQNPMPAGKNCYGDWANEYMRKTISYKHVVLNAPIVNSRYFGVFEGILITEEPLFAVGKFNYKFDPLFRDSQVEVLPLIADKIFQMSKE